MLTTTTAWRAGLAAMALATALHSSLAHECLHGHPTRNARVNEALHRCDINTVGVLVKTPEGKHIIHYWLVRDVTKGDELLTSSGKNHERVGYMPDPDCFEPFFRFDGEGQPLSVE